MSVSLLPNTGLDFVEATAEVPAWIELVAIFNPNLYRRIGGPDWIIIDDGPGGLIPGEGVATDFTGSAELVIVDPFAVINPGFGPGWNPPK